LKEGLLFEQIYYPILRRSKTGLNRDKKIYKI